jgi:hypothetical protein
VWAWNADTCVEPEFSRLRGIHRIFTLAVRFVTCFLTDLNFMTRSTL